MLRWVAGLPCALCAGRGFSTAPQHVPWFCPLLSSPQADGQLAAAGSCLVLEPSTAGICSGFNTQKEVEMEVRVWEGGCK